MGSILRNNFAQPSHFADKETPCYFRQPIGVFTFLIVVSTVASRFEICITVLGIRLLHPSPLVLIALKFIYVVTVQ